MKKTIYAIEKTILLLFVLFFSISIVGCSKNNSEAEANVVLKKYLDSFIKRDSVGVCSEILPSFIRNVYGTNEECKLSFDNTIETIIGKEKAEYKVKSFKKVDDGDYEEILSVLERDYKVDDTIENIYEFVVEINNNEFEFYLGYVDSRYYVILA